MASRRPTGRPTVQQASYLGQYQPQATPSTRTPQATRQIPTLNTTIQARYRAAQPQTGGPQVAGVSSPFSTPMADPGSQFRTNVPSSPSVIDYLMSALRPMLLAHQESTSTRIEQIGSAIETLGVTVGGLSNQIKDVRKETQDQTKDAATILERTHEVQLSTSRVLAARLAKLEKMIGTSNDRDDKSLLNRLDTISYAVEELLERAKDPDAPLSDTDDVIDLRTPEPQETKTYMDAAIDSRTPEPNTRSYIGAEVNSQTPEPTPVRHEIGTSPANWLYSDAAIDSRTPEPAPIRHEIGTGIAYQVYADAAIFPKTPEPLPPLPARHEFGTSPVRQTYLDTANGPRTPSPIVSVRSSARLSTSTGRRFSSGALTLVGDATDPEISVPIGLVYEVDVGSAPMDVDDSFDAPGTNHDLLRSPTAPVQAHFTTVPEVSKSLSLVDWSTAKTAETVPISEDTDEDEQDEPAPVFHPDPSPNATESFTLLKEHPNSPEGSVASLRLTTFGDSLAGPTVSSPSRPIPNIPVSSQPSVSPPSPYSLSPSCSPRVLSPRPQTPQEPGTPRQSTPIRNWPGTPIPISSPPPVADDPAPIRALTPALAPVLAQPSTMKSNPSTPAPQSPPAQTTDDPTPVRVSTPAPAPTPAQASTQDSVDHVQEVLFLSSPGSPPVAPNPVDEEEMPISQLITETFKSLEPPVIESSLSPPPQDSQAFGSAQHIDSPPAPEDPPETPSSPLPLTKTPTWKPPLPRRPPHLKSPTKSPFIDLRQSPVIKTRSSRDPSSPLTVLATKPTRTPRTSRVSKASTSKATVDSPIYISSRSISPESDLSSQAESDDDVKVIPVKKKIKTEHQKAELPPKKKYLIVKVNPPEKESAAATRVKKRKAKPSDATSEPPLKRARRKAGADAVKDEVVEIDRKDFDLKGKEKGKEVKGKGKGKETKGKESKGKGKASSISPAKDKPKPRATKARTKPLPGCEWPPKSQAGGNKFHQKFIECELCYYWYHYGCVGIKPGDPMAKGQEIFTCPPCTSNGANPLVANRKGVVCARPDCGEPSTDEYFVAGIVGRTTKVEGGRGRRYVWLVKWEGYPITQATWEEEEAMSDPQKLIEDFTIAAAKEGLPDDPHITLLLKEAVKGGCVDPNA